MDGRGRAEETLGRDAGELGHDLVGERRIGDRLAVVVEADRALGAGVGLLEGADLLAVLLVLLELDGDDRARVGRARPRPEASSSAAVLVARRVRASSSARWIVRLAGLVRAAQRRSIRARRSISNVRYRRKSRPLSLRILTARPRDRRAAAGRAGARPAARRPRPSTPIGLELRDPRLEVADERPGDRVRRRAAPLRSGRHARRRGRAP